MRAPLDPTIVALIASRWPGQRGDLLLALYRSHVASWDGVMPHRLVDGWFLGGTLPKGMRRLRPPALSEDDRARLLALHGVATGGHGQVSEMAAVLVNAFLWTRLFPEEFVRFGVDVQALFGFPPETAIDMAKAALDRGHVLRLLTFDINGLDSYRIATNRT